MISFRFLGEENKIPRAKACSGENVGGVNNILEE